MSPKYTKFRICLWCIRCITSDVYSRCKRINLAQRMAQYLIGFWLLCILSDIICRRNKCCPHDYPGRGQLEAPHLFYPDFYPMGLFVDFNLYPFTVIICNCECNRFSDFCDSFSWITEPEDSLEDHLNCTMLNVVLWIKSD